MKKHLKKYIGAALTLILTLGLGACGGAPKDGAEAARQALKALEKKSSAQLSGTSEMSATVSGEDLYGNTFTDMSLKLSQDMMVEYLQKPLVVHTSGTARQFLNGTESAAETEVYQVEEDGSTIMYSQAGGQWMRLPGGATLKSMAEGILTAIGDGEGSADLSESGADGEEIYVISAKLPAGAVDGLMSAAEGMLGYLEDFSDAGTQIAVTVNIDKETKLPSHMTLDLKDCGNAMLASMENMTGAFDRYQMTIDYTAFETTKALAVPPEVLDTAVDLVGIYDGGQETQEGELLPPETQGTGETTGYDVPGKVNEAGQYELLMNEGDRKAYIAVPEGFKEDSSSMYGLSLVNDQKVYITYTFAEFYSADTIADEFKAMMAYIEGDGLHENVQYSKTQTLELGGRSFSYICLTYDLSEGGSGAEYLAWTDDQGVLFVTQIMGLGAEDDGLIQEVLQKITFPE